MKKTLVAIAALVATGAFAQQLPSGANPNPAWGNGVRIIGGLDVGYAALQYKGSYKYSGVSYNGTYTSQIDLLGVEDLGGGMKADFFFESDINPTTQYNTGVAGFNGTYTTASNAANAAPTNANSAQAASTWGNGQVKVGLGGSFGYVAFGAVNNAGLDYNQYSGPFGTAFGSGYGVTQAAVGGGYGSAAKVRYDNSLRYLTPSFSGLQGSLTYRNKNDVAANNMFSTSTGLQGLSGVQELAAIYMNGPLNLIAVNQIDDANGTKDAAGTLIASAAKYTTNSIGGNYTMGAATLYAGWQNQKNDTTTNNKAKRVSIKYAATPVVTLMAGWNTLETATGTKSTVTGLGADYALSKTTALYFRAERADDGAGKISSTAATSATTTVTSAGFATSGSPDVQRNRTMVGLRTTF